jgi:hypothetical protein
MIITNKKIDLSNGCLIDIAISDLDLHAHHPTNAEIAFVGNGQYDQIWSGDKKHCPQMVNLVERMADLGLCKDQILELCCAFDEWARILIY